MSYKIAGVGEVLWDVFPDAAHFGGAPANFACHAASLGADSSMVSAVGTDDLGDRAMEKLRERHVRCDHMIRDAKHATGQVRVTLNGAGQASYEFAADTAWDHLPWRDELTAFAAHCDAICFGTLGQRSPASRATIRRFVEATPAKALRVFDVNLRQKFYDADTINASLQLASVVKLNDEELPVVGQLCGLQTAPPREMLKELASRFELRLAALTCGARGALLIAGSVVDDCPAPATTLVDTVGAGDAFTAALVMGFLGQLPLDAINRHANAVASYVCSQKGATPELPAHFRDLAASSRRQSQLSSDSYNLKP